MPYVEKWVAPEKMLKYRGIQIYHAYKDNDYNNGPLTWHYTTDPHASDDDANEFDVRELSTWIEPSHPPYLSGEGNTPENRAAWDEWHKSGIQERHIRTAIKAAILKGEIKPFTNEEDNL